MSELADDELADLELLAYLDGLEEDEEEKRATTLAAHPPVADAALERMVSAYLQVNELLLQKPLDPALSEGALLLQLGIYYATYSRLLAIQDDAGAWKYTMRKAEFMARTTSRIDDVEYV